jgi:uncharacterized RDD family membrane protein YckC
MTRELRLAGLFTRTVAFVIDALIINAAALVLGASVAAGLSLFGVSVSSTSLRAALGLGAWLAVVAIYFATFWTLTGQTPGLRAMGLRVITAAGRHPSRGQAARRLAGIALCVLTAGIGFLLVLVDERRRGLHDRLAGTLVVHDTGTPEHPLGADIPMEAEGGLARPDRGAYAPARTQARAVVVRGPGWER